MTKLAVGDLMPDIAMQPVTEMNRGDEADSEDSVPLAHSPGPANSGVKPTAEPGKASH